LDIRIVSGELAKIETGAVIVGMFEGEKRLGRELGAINRKLGRVITESVEKGEIKGKTGELNIFYSLGKIPAVRVAVVGLGKKEEFKLDKIRAAVAESCRALRQKKATDITILAKSVDGRTLRKSMRRRLPKGRFSVYTRSGSISQRKTILRK
jgi:leucyl aminopeptidase